MTEKELRQMYVDRALSYLGVREGTDRHHEIVDTYNAHRPLARNYKLQYTDAWCASFVSAMAILCGMTDIIPTEVGCYNQVELWKRMGRWQENDGYLPEVGDIVYYDWQDTGEGDNVGMPDHVGIVQNVIGTIITVIEGNKEDAVATRILSVNGRYIRGFGLPDYASKADPECYLEQHYYTVGDVPAVYRDTVDKLVALDILRGRGGTGDDRIIDFSEEAIRLLVLLDRAGMFEGGKR